MPPGGRTRHTLALAAATLLLGGGCDQGEYRVPPGPSWRVATHPRAADRNARLMRAFLTTADPPAVRQQLLCESGRIGRALGYSEAVRRMAAVEDTLVRTAADSAAYERADARTAQRTFNVAGPLCDSLRAVADREDGPIAPAPDSLRKFVPR